MSTPVKVGGKNDIFALKNARRLVGQARNHTEALLGEARNMQQSIGRPSYSRLMDIIGTLALTLAKGGGELDEMMVIRASAGVPVDTNPEEEMAQLRERQAALEAQVAELTYKLERMECPR